MGKGRERVRSDRRPSKPSGAPKARKPSPLSSAKSTPARPDSPKTAKVDGGSGEPYRSPDLVKSFVALATDGQNREDLQYQLARRPSSDGAGPPSLSTQSLHCRASLMLEIMDAKSRPIHEPPAARSCRSSAQVWRPPRRPAVTQDGAPDPYAFARDELIVAPHGPWAHGGGGHRSMMGVMGVSVSQVEQDEVKLLEHYVDSAMELDEKQESRTVTPLNDQPVSMTESKAKKSLAHTAMAIVDGGGRSSPGMQGQKRRRPDEPAQFSAELELIGGYGKDQSSETAGNKPKRVALNQAGRKRHEVDALVDVTAATSATTSTEPSTMASLFASDAKAYSPAVSPVDCEGSIEQPAASSEKVDIASVAQPRRADDEFHVSRGTRLHSSAKTSSMNGMIDATVSMGIDGEVIQQPSPSAFRRLAPRGTLNLG